MVCRVCIALFKGSESEALSDLRRAQRSGLGGTRPKRGFETAAVAGGSSWKADKAEREVVEKKEAHMASGASKTEAKRVSKKALMASGVPKTEAEGDSMASVLNRGKKL